MFGYRSRMEVLSLNARGLYHSPQAHDVLMVRLRRERIFSTIELSFRRKDGSPIWVLANMSMVDENTASSMIQGTVIDITERKFAEEGLRNAESKYRSIFENAAEGIFTTLTKRRLKREVFRSVADLRAAINGFVDDHNAQSKPSLWIADPDEIMAAVRRGQQALDSIY